MKILLANYRYFISGGPERYMFNVSQALTERKHEVIPFSINYTANLPTPYAKYFVEPLGERDEVYFRQQRMKPRTFLRTIQRLFYAPDVAQAVQRVVRDTQPEIAFVLHYLRKLSPALLVGLKKAGLPIVVRLSDYAMICPEAHCLRDDAACELCFSGDLWPSVRYRCLQGSRAASALNLAATWFHRASRYFDLIDVFITTTKFMRDKMLAAGYAKERLVHIPTFVNSSHFQPSTGYAKANLIAYAGRLEKIKGIQILIEAIGLLKSARPDLIFPVKLIGSGDESYVKVLKDRVAQLGLVNQIEFLGELNANNLAEYLKHAQIVIVPSITYENLPNAILESYASGSAVIASRMGSMIECVSDGQSGYLFTPGDPVDLAEKIAFCLDHPELTAQMGRNARRLAETIYSEEQHLDALENLLADLIARRVKPGQGLVANN